MMSLVDIAMCCTPAPELKSTYSWICDFFRPCAGSLIGILIGLVLVGDHHRAQCRVFGRDVLVVDRPQALEAEDVLVELTTSLHFAVGLVADDVIDEEKTGGFGP